METTLPLTILVLSKGGEDKWSMSTSPIRGQGAMGNYTAGIQSVMFRLREALQGNLLASSTINCLWERKKWKQGEMKGNSILKEILATSDHHKMLTVFNSFFKQMWKIMILMRLLKIWTLTWYLIAIYIHFRNVSCFAIAWGRDSYLLGLHMEVFMDGILYTSICFKSHRCGEVAGRADKTTLAGDRSLLRLDDECTGPHYSVCSRRCSASSIMTVKYAQDSQLFRPFTSQSQHW